MLSIISLLTTIIANSFFGVLVFTRAPRKQSNQKFALLSLSLVGWISSLFVYYIFSTSTTMLFWGRMTFVFAAFIPAAMFEFVVTFPEEIISIPKWFEFLIIFCTFFMAMLSFTPLVDTYEVIKHGTHTTLYGPFYVFYLISLVAVSIMSILLLMVKLKKASFMNRIQLQYLFLAFASLATIAILTNGILPFFFHIFTLDPFGPFATILFLGFICYAMVKHHFLDMNRITAGTAVYVSSIIALGLIYFTISYFVGILFFPQAVDIRYIMIAIFLSLGFKYAISPVRNFFWRVTNNFFYGDLYNREDFFDALSQLAVSSLHFSLLVEKTLQILRTKFIAEYAAFLVVEGGKVESFAISHISHHNIYFTQKDASLFSTLPKEITRLEAIKNKKLHEILTRYKTSLIMSMALSKKRRGYIILGQKRSGSVFSTYDITTLHLVAPTILISLQNTAYVEKIKLFNADLKKEVHKATRQLRHANVRLRHADKLKDEFISLASHELKTPTTAMQGFLWLVLQKDKRLTAYSKEKLEKVARLIQQLTALVNDMLDVSKIESSRISMHPEQFDIGYLIEEIKGEVDLLAIQKDITLSVKNSKHFSVWADKERVHQVVSNLLSNALKYTQQGGKVSVSFKRREEKVEVAIVDTGIGIRHEDIPKLFTKFGKLEDENSVSSHLPGSGLGLYISKNFVELLGGEIDVNSTYGKGSTFTFSLPVREMV